MDGLASRQLRLAWTIAALTRSKKLPTLESLTGPGKNTIALKEALRGYRGKKARKIGKTNG